MKEKATPVLYIVIPCYNEEKVLPITAPEFQHKVEELVLSGKISRDSRILFVNDGSRDATLHNLKKIFKAQKCPVKVISFSREP